MAETPGKITLWRGEIFVAASWLVCKARFVVLWPLKRRAQTVPVMVKASRSLHRRNDEAEGAQNYGNAP